MQLLYSCAAVANVCLRDKPSDGKVRRLSNAIEGLQLSDAAPIAGISYAW